MNTESTELSKGSMFFNNVYYGGIKAEGTARNNEGLGKGELFGKKRRLSESDSSTDGDYQGERFNDDSSWPLGVLNDPNCMLGLIKNHVIGVQERGQSMFRDAAINHWLYELKDEREIVQDL